MTVWVVWVVPCGVSQYTRQHFNFSLYFKSKKCTFHISRNALNTRSTMKPSKKKYVERTVYNFHSLNWTYNNDYLAWQSISVGPLKTKINSTTTFTSPWQTLSCIIVVFGFWDEYRKSCRRHGGGCCEGREEVRFGWVGGWGGGVLHGCSVFIMLQLWI